MQKDQCELAIRYLSQEWAESQGAGQRPGGHLSFFEFKRWLSKSGYSQYLNFQSVDAAENEAKIWFDQEVSPLCHS